MPFLSLLSLQGGFSQHLALVIASVLRVAKEQVVRPLRSIGVDKALLVRQIEEGAEARLSLGSWRVLDMPGLVGGELVHLCPWPHRFVD